MGKRFSRLADKIAARLKGEGWLEEEADTQSKERARKVYREQEDEEGKPE